MNKNQQLLTASINDSQRFLFVILLGLDRIGEKTSMKVELVSGYSLRVSIDGSRDKIADRLVQPWELLELDRKFSHLFLGGGPLLEGLFRGPFIRGPLFEP